METAWDDLALPEGTAGVLLLLGPDGAARLVESPGMALDAAHHHLLEAARATCAGGGAHALALTLALATEADAARLALLDALEALVEAMPDAPRAPDEEG